MCELIVETMLIDESYTAVSFSCSKTGKAIVFSDLTGEYCEDFCNHDKQFEMAAIKNNGLHNFQPLSTLDDIRI